MKKLIYILGKISFLPLTGLILCSLLVTSCGIFNKNEAVAPDESFDLFYRKFHSDMDFQKVRVHFPLDGYRVDSEGKEEWTPENYELHRSTIEEVDREIYEVEVIEQPGEVKEVIYAEGTGFYFSRTFRKIDGLWYLTSCTDENL